MVNGKATLVIGFVLAVVLGMVFLSPIVQAANDNTGSQDVVNETVSADYDRYADLGGYDIDENSETVYGFNDTSGSYEVVSSPGDYEMRYGPGEIRANSSSTIIDDGEDIKVSYTYQASDGLTQTVATFVPVILVTLLLAAIANGIQREM